MITFFGFQLQDWRISAAASIPVFGIVLSVSRVNILIFIFRCFCLLKKNLTSSLSLDPINYFSTKYHNSIHQHGPIIIIEVSNFVVREIKVDT